MLEYHASPFVPHCLKKKEAFSSTWHSHSWTPLFAKQQTCHELTLYVSGLVFPSTFLVVEPKAYATDNQIFQTQKQAAGSEACGLQMQLSLMGFIGRPRRQVPGCHLGLCGIDCLFFFSNCNQRPPSPSSGPILRTLRTRTLHST